MIYKSLRLGTIPCRCQFSLYYIRCVWLYTSTGAWLSTQLIVQAKPLVDGVGLDPNFSVDIACVPPYANNQAIFVFGTKICCHNTLDFWRHVASILHCGGSTLPAARRDQSVKWACFTDIPTFPLVVHVVGWGFMPMVQGNVHNLVCRARWWNQFFCLVEVPCTLSWWRHYVHGTLPACDAPAHTSQRWVWPNQWTSFCVAYRRTDQILWLVNGSKELLVKQPCVHFYEKVKIRWLLAQTL